MTQQLQKRDNQPFVGELPQQPPIPCPCGGLMLLRNSRFGLFYGCDRYPRCSYKHGAHQADGRPLGIPADDATRKARIAAHAAFDPWWRSGRCSRTDAYKVLAKFLDIPVERCHIGEFDKETCERIVKFCTVKKADS